MPALSVSLLFACSGTLLEPNPRVVPIVDVILLNIPNTSIDISSIAEGIIDGVVSTPSLLLSWDDNGGMDAVAIFEPSAATGDLFPP